MIDLEKQVAAIIGNFEEYATDHARHRHCVACGGCLLDPRAVVVLSVPLWCIGCKNRIEINAAKSGIPLPWPAIGDFTKFVPDERKP